MSSRRSLHLVACSIFNRGGLVPIIRQLLFDGDDTLWACRHNYFLADWACGLIIGRELGTVAPPPHEILAVAKSIERAAMDQLGFRFNQFEDAWVDAYRQLMERFHLPARDDVAQAIFYEAAYVKRAAYPVYPKTHDVLNQVRPMVESMHLISMGDRDFQMHRKIIPNGLETSFDSIHITGHAKRETMERLRADGPSTVMFGDNIHTDMEPALDLGLTAVWKRNNSLWAESERGLDPRIHVIDSTAEYPDLLAKIINQP